MSSLIARVGATCAGVASLAVLGVTAGCADTDAAGSNPIFRLEEATIAEIQRAIQSKQVTSTELVTLYLNRIKAYNGTCVQQPDGILGVIETIPHAGQINALSTLNLRPAPREELGLRRAQGAQHDRYRRRRTPTCRTRSRSLPRRTPSSRAPASSRDRCTAW